MTRTTEPVITRREESPREDWDDPLRGKLSFYPLFDSDLTPTEGLTAGIAELVPDAGGRLHRHAQPEIYYLLEGAGLLTIGDTETTFTAGQTAFIPGHAWHALRNTSQTVLRLLYVFPSNRLADVVYEYAP